MTEITSVAFCPHCSNRAPQHLVHVQRFRSHGFGLDGSKTDFDFDCAYFVAECLTCLELLLYVAEVEVPPDSEFVSVGLHWPDPGVLGDSVPEEIRRCYSEAAAIKNLAPNAFAVQIRRALEALCKDRSAKGRTLNERLAWLVTLGEIPPVLAQMTTVLRMIGNIGAHASNREIKAGHVRPIDEFFRAIVEYVYIAPHKIKKLQQTLEGKRSIFGED